MELRYVVLTSVARDDLPDHGASLFVKAMEAIRGKNPNVLIEVGFLSLGHFDLNELSRVANLFVNIGFLLKINTFLTFFLLPY